MFISSRGHLALYVSFWRHISMFGCKYYNVSSYSFHLFSAKIEWEHSNIGQYDVCQLAKLWIIYVTLKFKILLLINLRTTFFCFFFLIWDHLFLIKMTLQDTTLESTQILAKVQSMPVLLPLGKDTFEIRRDGFRRQWYIYLKGT